jgi:hypothetical protein
VRSVASFGKQVVSALERLVEPRYPPGSDDLNQVVEHRKQVRPDLIVAVVGHEPALLFLSNCSGLAQ